MKKTHIAGVVAVALLFVFCLSTQQLQAEEEEPCYPCMFAYDPAYIQADRRQPKLVELLRKRRLAGATEAHHDLGAEPALGSTSSPVSEAQQAISDDVTVTLERLDSVLSQGLGKRTISDPNKNDCPDGTKIATPHSTGQ